MIPEIIEQWEAKNHKLRAYLSVTRQKDFAESYALSLEKVVEILDLRKGSAPYNYTKIAVVDHGEYQGTQIFLIPTDVYQPEIGDYLFTHTDYGSCSGCDTLERIREYSDEVPDENQVRDYMTLALHLVQRMKRLPD